MKMSIVIPCYNEEENIPLILEKFGSIIKKENIEVILVNNGSTDNSKEILEKLLPKYQFSRVVQVSKNQGYGHGIIKGLEVATGEFLGWTHADLQTDPYDVIKAYKILEDRNWDKNIYIKGKRKNRTFIENFFTVGMSIFETLYLKKNLWDINGQPNIFSKDFYKTWENPPKDFSLDLYALFLAKEQKRKIVRINVLFPKRVNGKSSWNTGFLARWKLIKRIIKFSIELKRKGIK
ncbi:glycosyltransferase, group 2 family protein [Leptotrichia wadei]|jgi:Glycosyltransferases involved in cell wall biogenesis|uniref:Family 2 glycosyl transferase n=2 Tax=Leptotrichia wadei TaxID=157687 RepID=A0A133ZV04_9FUSO|nr:glycosyltransferase family 2 protein [Leptotrichia wadei]KXB59269.1 glycosyltransferase, group 2 family protein [Leptotrichia wadei]BBM46671.1 family 2 glycosyl transferase [Leptotrichia wadei]